MPLAPLRVAELKWTDTKMALRLELAIARPRSQRNKDVAVPGHHYPITAGFEDTFKSSRDVKCHVFL